MRHYRHHRRHRSHGYGSNAHHGWYGRDVNGWTWPQFFAEARKQKKFQRKNGKPHYGKIRVAWKHFKAGKTLMSKTSKRKKGQANFRARIDGLFSAIRGIAPARKAAHKKGRKKRSLTDYQKLRVAAAALKRGQLALQLAEKRVEKARAKAKTKAEKKVHNKSAAKVQTAKAKVKKATKTVKGLADKILDGKVDPKHYGDIKAAIDLQLEEIEKQEKIAKKAAEESAKAQTSQATGRASGFWSGFSGSNPTYFGHDPRRGKRKGKKKSKKSSKRKSPKRHAKKRSTAKKHHAKKRSTKKGKRRGPKPAYWAAYRKARRAGKTPKQARKAAAKHKKHGRDFDYDPTAGALFFA